MAISTGLAILGSTALNVGGSILAGNSTKKAANTAAKTEAANTAANNALALDIYNRNTANFQPWMQSGLRANSAFDEMLYGPSAQPPQPAPSAFAPMMGAGRAQPYAFASYGYNGADGERPAQFGMQPRNFPATLSNTQYGEPISIEEQMAPASAATIQAAPAVSARSAFDNYLNSTGYQFRFNEGMKGLNIGFGARGLLESGARDKAAMRYGQGIASDEFAKYMALLDNQQRLGFGGASALAGVGQNYAGLVTANNNNASSAAANAALARGAANSNMWGGIANSLGSAVGQLGSSYKAF